MEGTLHLLCTSKHPLSFDLDMLDLNQSIAFGWPPVMQVKHVQVEDTGCLEVRSRCRCAHSCVLLPCNCVQTAT